MFKEPRKSILQVSRGVVENGWAYKIGRVQIQKEVISDLKREKNQVLSKEIWESTVHI
jgi:hypothetical protein